jgi:tryptophan-rich sensory protein
MQSERCECLSLPSSHPQSSHLLCARLQFCLEFVEKAMQAPVPMDSMSEMSLPMSTFSEDEPAVDAPSPILVTKDVPPMMEGAKSHSTAALVIGIIWAVAVAIGGMVVGMTSRLTGDKALKTPSGQNYYDIVRPGIAPAPPAFVAIWTALFLSFGAGGVAMILPWIMRGVNKSNPQETARLSIGTVLYVVILGLLYAWMPVFAKNEQPKQAAFLLVAMLVLYVPLLFIAFATSWWASTLLAPLFGWLIVALVMNSDSVDKWLAYSKKTLRQKVEQTVQQVMRVQPGQSIDLGEGHVSGAK